jgi:hypothetical protein
MKSFFKKYRMYALFIVVGGVGGFLYWHYVGCASGTCPITSNWHTSSGYGMIMGGLLAGSFKKKDKQVEA